MAFPIAFDRFNGISPMFESLSKILIFSVNVCLKLQGNKCKYLTGIDVGSALVIQCCFSYKPCHLNYDTSIGAQKVYAKWGIIH